ncbi:MAG: protein kinase domain-containing protein [Polyangiales bacterium]
MDAHETLKERFRELGFDSATVHDAGATIRATPEMIELATDQLPRISVDLPSTFAPKSDRPAAARTGRPELEVQQVLGEGGMGRVFLARQRSLDREVAIKTLRDQASPRDYDALILEGAVTGHLEHPSIIPVHALGVHDDGRPVLVMKRVDGVSWQALLEDPKHPAWEGFAGTADDRLDGHLEILMQVCNAVSFAHSRGIAHRDIKPQNVLIGRFGDVYLADWGIAHRMASGPVQRLCGTPSFMAPEMALGGEIDARTDVYLLGATLHQVLTGKLRHEGETIFMVLIDAVDSPPFEYPSTVPEDLAALANRATSKGMAERPASAAEFRKALADHLHHKSSMALAKSALPRLERLRALLASPDENAQHEVDRLVAEVRFALGQATEQWSDNAEARRALAELEAMLEARRARTAELERLARDLDPSISARPRAAVVAILGCLSVALLVVAVSRGVRTQPSPRQLLMFSFAPLGIALGLTVVLRRHLMSSSVNRQTIAGLLIGTLSITLERALGLKLGIPTASMIVHDCLLGAAMMAFAATSNLPRWLVLVWALMMGAAIVITFFPLYAHFTFNLTMSIVLLVCAAFAWDKRAW